MTMPHQFELFYHLHGESLKAKRRTFATEEALDDHLVELDEKYGLHKFYVRYINHEINLEVVLGKTTYKSS
jgi:hypothetical protein